MKKKKNVLFITVGVLMIVVGAALMLHRVTGGRLSAEASIQLVVGFTTVALGAMLLTESAIAVFFYFLYVLSFLIVQINQSGILSPGSLGMIAMFILGIVLAKSLRIKRR
jgi:hypothetical protein